MRVGDSVKVREVGSYQLSKGAQRSRLHIAEKFAGRSGTIVQAYGGGFVVKFDDGVQPVGGRFERSELEKID